MNEKKSASVKSEIGIFFREMKGALSYHLLTNCKSTYLTFVCYVFEVVIACHCIRVFVLSFHSLVSKVPKKKTLISIKKPQQWMKFESLEKHFEILINLVKP